MMYANQAKNQQADWAAGSADVEENAEMHSAAHETETSHLAEKSKTSLSHEVFGLKPRKGRF